jgi:NAD(P)-dependent dehydrogenase (short-subunit alcohol dehydrogenase family)
MSNQTGFIVTGAGSGIGQAIAKKIVAQGHQVFGLGRDIKKLEATAKEFGAKAFAFTAADLSSSEQSNRAVGEARRWLKSGNLELRGLVNNAGVFDLLSFNETPDAIWERQFQNNLLSAVRLARDFYPELKAAGHSSILNISSNLGLRPIENTTAYSAIKAAMNNWTLGLAKEWAKDGIRVNCVCPGLVDTPIHSFHSESESSKARQDAHAIVPLGRMGTVEEIAEASWFLLSEASNWTTGTILNVDGGLGL